MLIKLVLFFSLLFSVTVSASEVEIVKVVLTENLGSWRADVTLKHADTGWKHYTDGWRVVDKDGKVLGNRVLYHPHVNEQPFTRSLSSFSIPKDKKIVFVEAHDLNRGWSLKRMTIDLQVLSGDNYTIRHH